MAGPLESAPPACSRCGKSMESGFVVSRGLWWARDRKDVWNSEMLGDKRVAWLNFAFQSWRCPGCKLVLMNAAHTL